jgi:hypothetical protein
MMPRPRVPIPVWIFFAIDAGLGIAYLVTSPGSHDSLLARFLDLDRENNLPTWYSTIQWFCVASLLGIFAIRNFNSSKKKSWLLLALPLVFLGLSLDEMAQIHERLGFLSDALLPGGSRGNTALAESGVWMFLFGIPFAIFLTGLMISIKTYFRQTPAVLVKLSLGMAIMLTGALGFETLGNFVSVGSSSQVFQVFAEEMCELLGSTIVLWGSYELLAEHGFTLKA